MERLATLKAAREKCSKGVDIAFALTVPRTVKSANARCSRRNGHKKKITRNAVGDEQRKNN